MEMKFRKRVTASVLTAALLCTSAGSVPVYGAPAGADVDETMYVNLDYYGKTTKVNVVKGVNLNGLGKITDYGNYINVENMSTSDAPVLGDGSVTWNLPEGQKGRFYYKCTMDNEQVVLPWDFDVSYKLNGVPTDGNKLAGANGLIEINVKATPNDNADLYYRNNMMLMVTVPVDMSKCYSVDADGAQIQSLGSTTAAVFSALPGEEGDYTVRIGTDSFETTGVIMAMAPGTIDDLNHIKDLKEAKDTWKDAGDALYDSLEQMAKSVESMRDGINQVQSGVSSAESARQKWSANKDSILAGNDQTLESLTALSQQLETLVPHLQTAKDTAETVHNSMGDIVNTMGDMQQPLRKMYDRLRNISTTSQSLGEQLDDVREDMAWLIQNNAQFQVQTTTILEALPELIASLENYDVDDLDLGDLEDTDTRTIADDPDDDRENKADTSSGNQEDPDTNKADSSDTVTEDKTSGDMASEAAGADHEDGGAEADNSSHTADSAAGTDNRSDAADGADISDAQTLSKAHIEKHEVPLVGAPSGVDLVTLYKMLSKIDKDSREFTQVASNLMDNVGDAAKYGADLTDSMDLMIEDLTALHDSLDMYYPDLQASLDDLSELVNRTTDAMNKGISTMTIVQNTLKATSGDMDEAAKNSLRGSMELLDKSLSILDSTTGVRTAGRTMKDVMDEQLDKFDTDNRFLFIDPSEDKVSFTSDKNPAPKTLQVVLRTDEISLDDENNKETDAEAEKANEGPLKRMWNVLVQMWKAIISIFKNR
ncbi:MAG: methyl-accepting chemotaxis protein [Enterocloster sp.]|nr:methyl-accepting chemotaxis protein [Enterocloster sp.]